MISMTVSPNLSIVEQARHYLSPDYLAQYCLSYYQTICAYTSHWVEVSYGAKTHILNEDSSQGRKHALNFIRSDNKIRQVLRELGLDNVRINFRNMGTVKKVKTITNSERGIAVSIESRNSRLWDSKNAFDWIIALPDEQRLITVSSSSIKGIENQVQEDSPSFLLTNDINTNGMQVMITNLKVPPYVSRGRINTEGGIKPIANQNSHIWGLEFMYKTPNYADKISSSLKIKNNEITFDHLVMLSHPTEHGKIILGQYYLCPIKIIDYEYETGMEISQRVIKDKNNESFYITSKQGRKIERIFEECGEVYILALIKQYFGISAKKVLNYKIVDKQTYYKYYRHAILNEHEQEVTYIPLGKIHQLNNSGLLDVVGGFSKGDRVINRKVKYWGIGTVLGFRHIGQNRFVARIDFQYGGIREVLMEDYLEFAGVESYKKII